MVVIDHGHCTHISYSTWALVLLYLLFRCHFSSLLDLLCFLTTAAMRRGLLSDDDPSTYASMDSSSGSSSSFVSRLSPASRYALLAVSMLLMLLLGVGVGWVVHGSFAPADDPNGQKPPSHILSPLVVYISINGFRASYLNWYMDYLPAMRYITQHGLRAREMNPVLPSVTYPNHYTLSTGLWPESHGLVSNSMYDPVFDASFDLGDDSEADGRWYAMAEPVWVTAKRQGLKTAVHFWAGSDAEIDGVRPDSYTPFNGVDDDSEFPDNKRLVDLLHLIETGQCQLCMMHLDNVDHMGHMNGPTSNRTLSALITYDNWLQRLLDGLQSLGVLDRTHLVIVSDHGMAQDVPTQTLSFANYTKVVYNASDQGAFSALWPVNPNDTQQLYSDLSVMEHATVFLKNSTVAQAFHYSNNRRIAPVLIQSDESWQLYTRARSAGSGGSHGYTAHPHSNTHD